MDPSDFINAIRLEFPDLSDGLDDHSGLFCMEMGQFAVSCRHAVDVGDRDLVKQYFEFARRAWMSGDNEVQNALGVAFIEHLNFVDGKVPRRWAFDLLPPVLQAAAVQLGVAPN